MDVQTGLVYVAVVVISALVIGFVSVFAMKEKSYEEAIAEQRKLPDDLLLGKKESKNKEKKHKNKTGKKVKEKKEEKEEKEEKPEHVQFEDTPQILPAEPLVQENGRGSKKKGKVEKVKPILVNKDEPVAVITEPSPLQHVNTPEINHFDVIQPKDDLELIRSHSRENLHLISQSETQINKSPKDTPTKLKKNFKDKESRKKDPKDDLKEEKRETVTSSSPQNSKENVKEKLKEPVKEFKESKETKEFVKEVVIPVQSSNKESKKIKKKNDILAQIGGDRDGINYSLLKPLVQKAELSRSEIQFLIDQLLNKQQDNPLETTEWTESRADPVIKLKKQLAEKEKALKDEQEASVSVQNKLLELRAELNGERSRLTASVRQLEEALNSKVTEAQTLHTRMQHILESHAAEKQGFSRQIEQLQAKINEDQAIIVKMQEDQGQTHGQMQQELIAQRKQLEGQFSQMRETEKGLKAQLNQKIIENTELQNVNITLQQEFQATCESSTHEIEMLRQENTILQEQIMHLEGQLQHFKEAGDRLQDLQLQLEDSRRAHADSEHRLKNIHRHEQELQKQVTWLQSELDKANTAASTATALKEQLEKALSQLAKLKSDQPDNSNEETSDEAETSILQSKLKVKEEELLKTSANLEAAQLELKKSQSEIKKLESELSETRNDLKSTKSELARTLDNYKLSMNDLKKCQDELREIQHVLAQTRAEFSKINSSISTVKDNKSAELELQIIKLQEENQRISSQLGSVTELQKEVKQLRENNESLSTQLAVAMERPTLEGRENGIEEKAQKNRITPIENTKQILAQKEELNALRTELTQKEKELDLLTSQVASLKSDVNSQRNISSKLQHDLEQQRSKNDDLRRKNWKVMEALNSAESRNKKKDGVNEDVQKLKIEEQEATQALLQRIFPDVKISEKSHDKWMKVFEEQVNKVLSNLKTNAKYDEVDSDLEKTNQSLQAMVNHYKQIIYDTEKMLNKLQSHIESEEKRWQAQLRQKENEVSNLRIEINELQEKVVSNNEFQEKITELEKRLTEAQSIKQNFQISHAQESKKEDLFSTVEQLKEEKSRLYQQLQNESSEKALVNAEVVKLRSIVETSKANLAEEKELVLQLQQEISQIKNEICGGSSSDLSMLNGPPLTDSPRSEPSLGAQCLIAAFEKTLHNNTELENCSSTETDFSVVIRQDIDDESLTSKLASNSCLSTDNFTYNSCNPTNGQQHKKHKKKRKGGSGKK